LIRGVPVTALIRRQGTTEEVLHALSDRRFAAIYSIDIMTEIIDILGRPHLSNKYHIEPDDITAIINLLRLRGEIVTPQRKINA
jgi:predicted nucleic acid-binding protein